MFPNVTNFSFNISFFVEQKCGSNRIFFLTEVLLFPRAHWFSNRGGEWHEPSIYISLYVGKDLNMALNQDTRVVLFLLHSTEEVHKKLVIIFWEIYYFRHILVRYVYPETHVQKWETFWYNKSSTSVGTVEKYIQSCNWHDLQPNSVRICTQLQVDSIIM